MIRILDFSFSLLGLILLFPFFLLIALIIKLSSRGPVLYKQKRVGLNGTEFNLIKLININFSEEACEL